MSYRRSFRKTIPVHYSGSTSETVTVGDQTKNVRVHYSGTVYEEVVVNVDIDTDPFDSSIRNCNSSVGVLTGSVVATEAAQVASIRDHSRKVGKTIIDGFFSTVKSDISQQIMELNSRLEANLVHLRELAQRCVSKQKQMEVDYNRLTSRYSAVFEDLNKELENRIYELDRPTFKFKEMSDASACRSMGNDMASTVVVAGAESGLLEATIGASLAKKQALTAIGKANTFLVKQKSTEKLLDICSIKESRDAVFHTPVCYIETVGDGAVVNRNLYASKLIEKSQYNGLSEELRSMDFPTSDQNTAKLKQHFSDEVAENYAYSSSHNERVRDYITKLFNTTIE